MSQSIKLDVRPSMKKIIDLINIRFNGCSLLQYEYPVSSGLIETDRLLVKIYDPKTKCYHQGVIDTNGRWESTSKPFTTPVGIVHDSSVRRAIQRHLRGNRSKGGKGSQDLNRFYLSIWPQFTDVSMLNCTDSVFNVTLLPKSENPAVYMHEVASALFHYDRVKDTIVYADLYDSMELDAGSFVADTIHEESRQPEKWFTSLGQTVYADTRGRVQWKQWAFTLDIDGRRGVVLRDIGWINRVDTSRLTPLCSALYLDEIFVLYHDSIGTYRGRAYYDSRMYGRPQRLSRIRSGVDIPNQNTSYSIVAPSVDFKSDTLPSRIAVYEQLIPNVARHEPGSSGGGILYTGTELVVLSIVNYGNYDYLQRVRFSQEGRITVELLATGRVLSYNTNADTGSDLYMYGGSLGANLRAPGHTHVFHYVVEMPSIAGSPSISEVEYFRPPIGSENRYGNQIVMDVYPFRYTSEVARVVRPDRGRHWKISTSSPVNGHQDTARVTALLHLPTNTGSSLFTAKDTDNRLLVEDVGLSGLTSELGEFSRSEARRSEDRPISNLVAIPLSINLRSVHFPDKSQAGIQPSVLSTFVMQVIETDGPIRSSGPTMFLR